MDFHDETFKKFEHTYELQDSIEISNAVLMTSKSLHIIFLPLFSLFIYFLKKKRKTRTNIQSKEAEISKLIEKLKLKNKELISKNIQLSQQNELIENIKLELKEMNLCHEDHIKFKKIVSSIKTFNSASNWKEFELYFNEIDSDFYIELNKAYPSLTANEHRLCGLIHLKLSSKDISLIIGKSVRSIEVARYRLRKKMNVEKDETLITVLNKVTNN